MIQLKLGDKIIPQVDTPTFLGGKFDTRMTWKAHIEAVRGKAIRKLAVMKKLCGTSWGANSKILKQVYNGSVRPVMEYASTCWSTSAKTNKEKLDKVQNQALGAIKTTPLEDME